MKRKNISQKELIIMIRKYLAEHETELTELLKKHTVELECKK